MGPARQLLMDQLIEMEGRTTTGQDKMDNNVSAIQDKITPDIRAGQQEIKMDKVP
jgi:hypothetical protein